MSALDDAFIAAFKEIYATGHEILGHTDFAFKIDATIGTRSRDEEGGKLIGARIQEALTAASRTVQPLTIEGVTLQ